MKTKLTIKKIIPIAMLYVASFFGGCSEKAPEINAKYKDLTITKDLKGTYLVFDRDSLDAPKDEVLRVDKFGRVELNREPLTKITYKGLSPRLREMANPDSVDMLIDEFIWARDYKEKLSWYSKHLPIYPDTLVRNIVNQPLALSDIDGDGKYDVMQYLGSSLGSYSITMTNKALDNYLGRMHVKVLDESKMDSVLAKLR